MKVVGRYLLIEILDEKPEEGKLIKNPHSDLEFRKAKVVKVGGDIPSDVVNEEDIIYFNRKMGHDIYIEENKYRVITIEQVVVVV